MTLNTIDLGFLHHWDLCNYYVDCFGHVMLFVSNQYVFSTTSREPSVNWGISYRPHKKLY